MKKKHLYSGTRTRRYGSSGSRFCRIYTDGSYYGHILWLEKCRQSNHSSVHKGPVFRKMAKNYALLNIDEYIHGEEHLGIVDAESGENEDENEEDEGNSSSRDISRRIGMTRGQRREYDQRNETISIMKDLITNPVPGFALRYRPRGYRSRFILSLSMAQELIWRLLRKRHWPEVERYFALRTIARRRLISTMFFRLEGTFWGISRTLIEGQVHLINSLVIRRNRQFEEVLHNRFTRLKQVFSNVIWEILSKSGRFPVGISDRRRVRRLDDDAYGILDNRISAFGINVPRWPNLDPSLTKDVYVPPKLAQRSIGRFIKCGMKKFRYCGLRIMDLQQLEGVESASETQDDNIKNWDVTEQLFDLASNLNPTQIIFDRTAEKLVISSSMCQELCWIYLPTFRVRYLERHRNELTRAMYNHLSHHFVAMSKEDVEEGLLFLLNYVYTETGRGVTIEDGLSDPRRKETFEMKVQPYRQLKKYNVARYDLIRLLLRDDNPAESDLQSTISDLLCIQSWSIASIVLSCPSMVLEWRDQLLTRNWSSFVHSLSRYHNSLSFQRVHRELCSENMWRLLVQLIRESFRGPPNALVDAVEEAIKLTPCFRRTDEARRVFELAMWNVVSNERTDEAVHYLNSGPTYQSIRPQEVAEIDSMKSTFQGLMMYHEMKRRGRDITDQNEISSASRIVRSMTTHCMAFTGANGVLAHAVDILQCIGEHAQAVELLEEYLRQHPDDLSVYELAVDKLHPAYSGSFASYLVNNVEWHSLVVEWCQYELTQQSGDIRAVVIKLLKFLDYGKNKDNTDAWESLQTALSRVNNEDEKVTIATAWNERRSWWSKFHLQKTRKCDEEVYELKKNIIDNLEACRACDGNSVD